MSILQYHARNGVLLLREEERADDSIRFPLAVIAGKREAVPVAGRLRWVYGDLYLPKACGDALHFGLNSFGNFGDDSVQESESVTGALSVYVDTILFGLKAALRAHQHRMTQVQYQPDHSSGQYLMIGDQRLQWPVYASPIPPPSCYIDQNSHMHISQGEMFCGELNVHETLSKSNLEATSYVEFGRNDQPIDVLIKVSSMPVHNMLTGPSETFSAMKGAKDVLKSPLLAAVKMDVGLVTIMNDLTNENYCALRPMDHAENLAGLWDGFVDLVRNTLLPLAAVGVVHADIRPGVDITSNILCKFDGDTVRMVLVDFESLVLLVDWMAPSMHWGYMEVQTGWNATAFVWWQCLAVAFAWIENRLCFRVGTEGPNFADLRSFQYELLHEGYRPEWLPQSLYELIGRPKIDQTSVHHSLQVLSSVFVKLDQGKK